MLEYWYIERGLLRITQLHLSSEIQNYFKLHSPWSSSNLREFSIITRRLHAQVHCGSYNFLYFFLCSCKLDETLEYHPANTKSERFSLKSFRFIGEHAFVFVHCHVRICNISDPDSKCVRVCEDRRKRDVTFASEDLDDLYPLAQGPLMLQKEEVTRERKAKPSSTGEMLFLNWWRLHLEEVTVMP